MTEDKYVFELWPSRSKFFCNGTLMTGPCVTASLVVWGAITVPVAVFSIHILPVALERHPTMAYASLALIAQMVLLLCATSCSNPGVIPARSVIKALGIADELSDTLGYCILGIGEPTRNPQIDANSMLPRDLVGKKYAWCRTCEIIRPPRASHCPSCDHCVLRYDHHCPFVNTCIAQRNYHYFIGFLMSVLIAAIFGLMVTMWWTVAMAEQISARRYGADSEGRGVNPSDTGFVAKSVFAASIGVGVVSCCVLGFLLYHVFLICKGRTTKEQRVKPQDFISETTLCAPRGPSLFNPRSLISSRYMAEAAASRQAGMAAYRLKLEQELQKPSFASPMEAKRKPHREGWLGPPLIFPGICAGVRRCHYKLVHARWRRYLPHFARKDGIAIQKDLPTDEVVE